MSKEQEDSFYDKFKERLNNYQELPGDYAFKFILESDNHKMATLQKIFDNSRPRISTRPSRNGKYTSVTVQIYAMDADEIIAYYKEASKIEGIILL